MKPETIHSQLRTLLAELYPTRADLTRVAYDAGIPLAFAVLGSSALNDWDAVLHEAVKQQIVNSLLDVVRQEYPRQHVLAEISTSVAAFHRATLVSSLPASKIHLLNFTHELTAEQYEQLEVALGKRIGKLIHLPVDFDNARPYGPQCVDLAEKVGLTKSDWTTLPIVVNPPGFVPGALALLSELHGRMGYFPAVVRLRPIASCTHAFTNLPRLSTCKHCGMRRANEENIAHDPTQLFSSHHPHPAEPARNAYRAGD